jgi:peptide/nickel transport system permease protein
MSNESGLHEAARAAHPAGRAMPALARPGRPTGRVARVPWLMARLRQNPIGLIGVLIIAATVAVALAAPLLTPYDPTAQGARRLLPPSLAHPMGTDELGRDTFARIVYGTRVSFQVGAVAVAIALALGATIGLLAGFFGRAFDAISMRVVDIMFAFPSLVLAIVIAGLLGPSRTNAMLAIGIVYAPAYARIVRSAVLAVMSEPYLEAARVAGGTSPHIIWRHVVPNVLPPVIVMTSLSLSTAILTEAGLSFLGLGTQPPEPAWGTMLNNARTFMELAPWLAIFPGLAIMIVVLGFNLLGDGLRDILDPRLRIQ